MLPDETEALRLRLEWLTGSPVSREAVLEQNPDMPLDFSRAPRFEQIVVSYLYSRADVSGYLVARALAFHAARGTRIRILVSASLALDLDRNLFESLAAQFPNVQIQYFRWRHDGLPAPSGPIDAIQRAQHIKLFLALSTDPGRSFAMVGGRNLSDGYFFEDTAQLDAYPFLRSYDDPSNRLAYHVIHEDFEVVLTDAAAVADIAAHFGKVWNRDQASQTMASGVPPARVAAAGEGFMRHYISLPWADGQALEDYYRDLIDAAREEIAIISPFNYPTPAIDAALVRAAKRGVRVRLISRLVSPEPPAVFTKALNLQYLERHRGVFDMRVLDIADKLLHTKLIIIDQRLGVVASANLNRRSFLHDTENGFVFLDRKVAADLLSEFDLYWHAAQPTWDRDTAGWVLRLMDLLPVLKQYF